VYYFFNHWTSQTPVPLVRGRGFGGSEYPYPYPYPSYPWLKPLGFFKPLLITSPGSSLDIKKERTHICHAKQQPSLHTLQVLQWPLLVNHKLDHRFTVQFNIQCTSNLMLSPFVVALNSHNLGCNCNNRWYSRLIELQKFHKEPHISSEGCQESSLSMAEGPVQVQWPAPTHAVKSVLTSPRTSLKYLSSKRTLWEHPASYIFAWYSGKSSDDKHPCSEEGELQTAEICKNVFNITNPFEKPLTLDFLAQLSSLTLSYDPVR